MNLFHNNFLGTFNMNYQKIAINYYKNPIYGIWDLWAPFSKFPESWNYTSIKNLSFCEIKNVLDKFKPAKQDKKVFIRQIKLLIECVNSVRGTDYKTYIARYVFYIIEKNTYVFNDEPNFSKIVVEKLHQFEESEFESENLIFNEFKYLIIKIINLNFMGFCNRRLNPTVFKSVNENLKCYY